MPTLSELGFAGVLVVAISRILMYHHVKRGKSLLIWHYLIWVAAEIIAMALFFTLFEIVILYDQRPFPELLVRSVQVTSLTLLLPYTFLWLWFAWREGKKTLSGIMEQPETASRHPMIHLRDEKGVLRLQYNVISPEGVAIAERGGLKVVVDRCVKVEHARHLGRMHLYGLNTNVVSARRPAGH